MIKKLKKWEILGHLPDGWQEVKGATTIPSGYILICNNESRFSGKRRTALLKK